jgi:hypothetical protein
MARICERVRAGVVGVVASVSNIADGVCVSDIADGVCVGDAADAMLVLNTMVTV